MGEMRNDPKLEKEAKEKFITALAETLSDIGFSTFRVNDYGTLAIEVPYPNTDGTDNVRVMELKCVWPRLEIKDKDSGEVIPYSLDEGILAYEARVQKDQIKAEKKAKETK